MRRPTSDCWVASGGKTSRMPVGNGLTGTKLTSSSEAGDSDVLRVPAGGGLVRRGSDKAPDRIRGYASERCLPACNLIAVEHRAGAL